MNPSARIWVGRTLQVCRRAYLCTAVVVLALVVAPLALTASHIENIILVVTDDQRAHSLKYMPKTQRLFADHGVQFLEAFATTPTCCPSRASIFTGLYSHNHGVLSNNDPDGGARKFIDTSTIATWLQAHGYRTGLFGKYLNQYRDLRPWPYVPPGWDEWHAFRGDGNKDEYFKYTLVENGVEVDYCCYPENYSTDVLAAKAITFIEESAPGQALFLYFVPRAPHKPARPAPADEGRFSRLRDWRPPSYNEADVSDKPVWVRLLPLLTPAEQETGDIFHVAQIQSLLAVDRSVAAIGDALRRTGRLTNSAIVYTSDNGLSWGEHRWLDRKGCVYEECTRVPFLVRAPGAVRRSERHLVGNIDLAPTILEWAGIVRPTKANGRSLARLVIDPSSPWRTGILLESLGAVNRESFEAARTRRFVYVEYKNGDRELYDLQADPHQLLNAVDDPAYAPKVEEMKRLLDHLRDDQE